MNSTFFNSEHFLYVCRGGVHHLDEIYKKIKKKTCKKNNNIAFYKKYKRRLSSSEKSAQSGNWSHRRSMLMQAPEEATRSCSLCFPFMLEYNMEDNVILVIMMVLLTMATMIVMRR